MPHPYADRLFCEALEVRDLLNAGPWLGAVLPCDIDGDGLRDVAVLRTSQVDIYRGTASGTYEAPRTMALDFSGMTLSAAGGLVVRGWTTDGQERSVQIGMGPDGSLAAAASLATLSLDQPLTRGPVVTDVNGDGRDDRLTLDEKGRVLLRLALPNGRFTLPELLSPTAPALEGLGVASAGGTPILFGVERDTKRFLFFERDEMGRFQPRFGPELIEAGSAALPPGMEGQLVVDGSGWLAALDAASSKVRVFGQESGTLQVLRTIDVGPGIVGLVNSAGRLLAATTSGDVLELDGPQQLMPVAAVDLNNDGSDELVYARLTDSLVIVRSANGAEIAFALTDVERASHVLLADLNGDGERDLIICDQAAARVLVYLGIGQGQFGPEVHGGKGVTVAAGPAYALAAQLRNTTPPGLLDLVVVSPGVDQISVLLGALGAGGWAVGISRNLNVGVRPTSVAVGDLTADGVVDLIVTSSGDNSVKIVTGRGDGSFDDTAPRSLATGSSPHRVALGDFDGDSRTDLVSLNAGSNDLTYYSNVASPASEGRAIAAGGSGPSSVLVRDMNRDGTDDLVVGNYQDGNVSLLSGGTDGPALTWTMVTPSGSVTALAVASDGETFWAMDDGEAWRMSFSDPVPIAPSEPTTDSGPALELQPLEEGALPLVPIWGGPRRAEQTPDAVSGEGSDVEPSVIGGETPTMPGDLRPGGSDVLPVVEEGEAGLVVVADEQAPLNRFLLGAEEMAAPDLAPDGTSEPPLPLPIPVLPQPLVMPVAQKDAAEAKKELSRSDEPASSRSLFAAAALLLAWRPAQAKRKRQEH